MKKIAIPLILLASISTLTSCTTKTEAPTADTPVPQAVVETPAPVPTPTPDATTPPVVPPVESTGTVPTSSTPVTKTETISYNTPAGNDDVEFSMTVTDGVITSITTTPKAVHDISKARQTAFAGEISAKVVGKKISELSLSAVGGSSLTTNAFNQFIQTF